MEILESNLKTIKSPISGANPNSMENSADAKGAGDILEFLIRETGIILSGRTEKISGDAPLPSLGFDSLSFVELLVSIERKFNLKLIETGISPEDVQTLGALARCIQRGLKSHAA